MGETEFFVGGGGAIYYNSSPPEKKQRVFNQMTCGCRWKGAEGKSCIFVSWLAESVVFPVGMRPNTGRVWLPYSHELVVGGGEV